LAWTRSLAVALGALAVYGVGTSTGMVTYNSLLHAEVPAPARGRVYAAFDMTWQSGRLASLALVGGDADQRGIQAVYLLGGGLLLLAGSLGLVALPTGPDADDHRVTAAATLPTGRPTDSADLASPRTG
jgi:MFS family permease